MKLRIAIEAAMTAKKTPVAEPKAIWAVGPQCPSRQLDAQACDAGKQNGYHDLQKPDPLLEKGLGRLEVRVVPLQLFLVGP
jgi:hypothetical protein